ncbi:MAG: TIM barrel protein [Bryobacteraceae bacterium]|nr:TIM barrel protein [Bryobacteraceae bacterium]
MTRREFVGSAAAAGFAGAASRRTSMGLTPDSLPAHRTRNADGVLEIAAKLGMGGGQGSLTSLEPAYLAKVRRLQEENNLYFEVQTRLAQDNTEEFEATIKAAKEAGARSIRAVCLGGRRYENFSTLAEWKAATAEFHKRIALTVPIVEKHRLPMGLENHKDWTTDEHVALLKKYSSEYLGVCLDTGNSISLLDDRYYIIEQLAPYAINTHLKDMGVEEYADGFLLSEVPMGDGMMDMQRVRDIIRKANPKITFSLEMITRDPLQVPCLTDKYWATLPDRNGVYLARTLAMVRANKPNKPLPRVAGLDVEARKRFELENVEACIAYARDRLGLV